LALLHARLRALALQIGWEKYHLQVQPPSTSAFQMKKKLLGQTSCVGARITPRKGLLDAKKWRY